ncbi:flagellar export protein FliJ [Oceanobacillus halotolerans]|uniref:flagellar export protein FliJ n=1 Tax=Oceanobacillus halotolerans TaxID=2663380 RepID=UPI0013DA967D|nr:flagellar export protein FliJ [Oceanobacillus halotolerans]
MTNTVTLTKILHIREREKKDAQKAYQHAMDSFEDIATQLYTLLKKKEDAEKAYDHYLQSTAPIDRLKEQSNYIERLSQQIVHLQQKVQQARNQMNGKQDQLTKAHVEVKKFEKLIENREQKQAARQKQMENIAMDETSVQQFLSYQTR